MRSSVFSVSISLFILLLVPSSQLHLSSSAKLQARLKPTNKQVTCSASSGCSDGLVCVNRNALQCSSSDSLCVCLPSNIVPCTPEEGCTSGLTCVETDDGSACTSSDQVCACVPGSLVDTDTNNPGNDSEDDSDNGGKNNDDDDKVCVDANLLNHLPMHELVYKSHRRASVLCDKTASCATAGHIVVFNGHAMMMSSYCNMVGDCQRRVMSVNSPKMSRKIRLTTNTNGLHFTAFASRYQTVVEERILSALIHMSM